MARKPPMTLGAAVRRTLWSARLALRGSTLANVAMLRSVAESDAGVVAEVRAARLAQLLRHAASQVPYYRELALAPQLREAGAHDAEDLLQALPIADRALFRQEGARMWSDDRARRGWFRNTSGGSTGTPVVVLQDRGHRHWSTALKIVFDEWSNYRYGDPKVVLWGSERDLMPAGPPVNVRIHRWLTNETWFNAFRLGESEFWAFIALMRRRRPTQLLAYAECVYAVARRMLEEDVTVPSPRAVMTSAGMLYGFMREAIETAFKAPVFNRYGSRETSDIACECAYRRGLHVSEATHIVELLRHDGSMAAPGESGEVVVTVLGNYSMPLLRYRLGDTARWAMQQCDCGCAWRVLEAIEGRVSDVFTNQHGEAVHGEYFTHLMYFRQWVRQFQVVQDAVNRVRFRIVLTPGTNLQAIAPEEREIERQVQLVMGEGCQSEWEFVPAIEPVASGKRQFTVSHVVRHMAEPRVRQ